VCTSTLSWSGCVVVVTFVVLACRRSCHGHPGVLLRVLATSQRLQRSVCGCVRIPWDACSSWASTRGSLLTGVEADSASSWYCLEVPVCALYWLEDSLCVYAGYRLLCQQYGEYVAGQLVQAVQRWESCSRAHTGVLVAMVMRAV
jgi:hypothetical protein